MLATPSLTDAFSALSDGTRCRMLWLLDQHELTVSELCSVLQLPQSTVSRHLKTLADAGWVTSRRDGTSRYYALALETGGPTYRQLWALTREELAGRPGSAQDGRRLAGVLAKRRRTSQEFFASAAGEWDRLRDELFGREFAVSIGMGLLPADATVADLGCGTGRNVLAMAPWVQRVIGIDASEDMLAAASRRTQDLREVDLRCGDLESLPLDDGVLDAATMILVWHHLPSPAAAMAEAARALRPGGRLLVVDMAPHDREDYRAQMGHVWLGFSDEQVRRLFTQAGFVDVRIHPLPPAEAARGPTLFAAAGCRAEAEKSEV